MKYLHRSLSMLLALVMFFQCSFTGVVKASAEDVDLSVTTGLHYVPESAVTNEEAFAEYALQQFYGSSISFFGNAAGEMLTGDEKVLYDAMVPYIRQIANGERASASIAVGQTATVEGDTYVADVEAEFTGTTITQSMFGRVINALLSDLPYEMYWFDKTSGYSAYEIAGSKLLQVGVHFVVASNYRGADAFTADVTKTGAAKAAAANAKSIVNRYADSSDYEKLVGYRNDICALVEYDDAAAEGGYFSTNIDPWQLISVFDGDSDTNVVCEGYSKAFMYLCDMTEFSGDVACYTVSGDMFGGAHMWNVVTIAEKNYLVDVTNSESDTIGYNGSLFLAGGTGSAAAGYSVADIPYVYDSYTQALWGIGSDSILTLAETGYVPESENNGVIASGTCGENATWTLYSNGLLSISGTGAMTDYLTSIPWFPYRESINRVTIEDGITTIGCNAFSYCTGLTSVTIPDSVTTIGAYAFHSCTELTSVTIPDSVTTIGTGTFKDCIELTSVTIGNGVTTIGGDAFNSCTGLTSVTIPDSVTTIDTHAFYSCTGLTSVTIPDSVTTIGTHAFSYCTGLTSVTIPDSVTTIGTGAFFFCSKLQKIEVDENNAYYSSDDRGVLFNKDKTDLINVPCAIAVDYEIPNTVTTIGDYAFYSCRGLTSVTIPDSVTTIRSYAFYNSFGLTEIIFEGDAPTLGYNCFWYDTATAYYPAGNSTWDDVITQTYGGKITWKAHCLEGHTEEIVAGKAATCTEDGLTDGKKCTVCGVVTVEQEVILAGHTWEDGKCTVCGTTSWCGEDITWAFDEETGTLTISGTGTMYDYSDSSNAPWYGYRDQILSVTIQDGVTSIGDFAFSGTGLRSVIIPASVEEIGDEAFGNCQFLTEVTFVGNAPIVEEDANVFNQNTLTVYYPTVSILDAAYMSEGETIWVPKEEIDALKSSYGGTVTWVPYSHKYDDDLDGTCNDCGVHREDVEHRILVNLYRMYNPYSGEHFYSGSEVERDFLISVGWNYEGVAFTFPANTGAPVHRLYHKPTGEHLYTMFEDEKDRLLAEGWNYEGIAFNSAYDTEAFQNRLHNPYATVGAYHFTFSQVEKQVLLNAGWEYQGLGWYSVFGKTP